MFCFNCGNQIESKNKFCTKCGQLDGGSEKNESINSENKETPQSKVPTTSNGIKKLLKIIFWLGLVVFGIWLIIALGPLWIIAIILLLILFVVANK